MNILIIENSAEFRADIRQMLTYASAGACRFQEADKGEDGIRLCREGCEAPQCVLLSHDLPDMKAQQVITAFRGGSDLPPFPVVVLASDKSDGRGLLREGAQDYVAKTGMTSSNLLLAIENAVERFRLILEHKRTLVALQESQARLNQLLEEAENRRLELQAIMEAVPAQVWISRDQECRRIFGNRAVYEFVGCEQGQNVSMTAPLAERPAHFQTYRHGIVMPQDELPMQWAARTGQAVRGVDLELRFADGSSKWIYGNAEPLRDANGNLCGAIAGMVDFTEQKRAYDALTQREQALRAAFDVSEESRLVLSRDGIILEVNAAALRWLGRTRAEVIAFPWAGTVGEKLVPESRLVLEGAMEKVRGGQLTAVDVFQQTEQGKRKMRFALKPIPGGAPHLNHIVAELSQWA